jgi:hypothetical protein
MKYFLFALLLFLTSPQFAQSLVKEEMVAIDGKSRNSLSILIKNADVEGVKKDWKKLLKDLNGKVSEKAIVFCDDCEDKSLSDNTFDVYSTVNANGEGGVRLIAAFDLGGAYLSTEEHPHQYPAAEQIMSQFAVSQAKEVLRVEISTTKKILKGFEKDFSGLEKDKERLEKEIEEHKNKIEEAKAAIKKNLENQAIKKTEVSGLKATITQLETKQKSIK